MARVIIAGGTGLVGQALVQLLADNGFVPIVLTRSQSQSENGIRYSCWDPHAGVIDADIFSGEYYIVNLSGENIGAKRWTDAQKQRIAISRTEPAELLARTCAMANDKPVASVSMSAVGIYGAVSGEYVFAETDRPFHDFLANTCQQWERASHELGVHAQRTVILRLGVVLSADGGALPLMARPVRMFVGSYIGTGKQYISWIHIDDLCRWILYCIENDGVCGVFNTAAEDQVSNREFTRRLCTVMHRPFIPFGVPRWVLRMFLGEMSAIATEGSRVNTDKILNSGFKFTFPDLDSALHEIFK